MSLNSYQRRVIVYLATRQEDSYPQRAERLKALSFCTDDVKFDVLKNNEEVSKALYDCLHDLYFDRGKKYLHHKKWMPGETVQLIDCYNKRMPTQRIAAAFGVSVAAIDCRISWLRKNPLYSGLFTLEKCTRRMEVKT